MLEIDGAQGEGGGQILRTSLSLAALSGQAVRLRNIREGRTKPGLAAQHLTVVRALSACCQARLEGDEIGSQQLIFEPASSPQSGDYRFDVAEVAEGGSAGSVTLLAQALLPPLVFASGGSTVRLQGGTHVRWSPSFHYLESVYLPIWRQLGLTVQAELMEWGFYPAGGGRLLLELEPKAGGFGRSLDLRLRGDLKAIEGVAVASNLSSHIPQRMTDRARNLLADLAVPFNVRPKRVSGAGPGAGIFLTAVYERVAAGFSGHGQPGKPAQAVAEEACRALLAHHDSRAAVDEHLADQLLLPLALSGRTSTFSTGSLTSHFETNASLIERLLPSVEITWQAIAGGNEVTVAGAEIDTTGF